MEKFSDVCVLMADVVNFDELAGHGDTADCIMALNRMYSTFDSLMDKYGVHKASLSLLNLALSFATCPCVHPD